MKKCTKCKEMLEISFFGLDSSRKDGLSYACKPCRGKWREKYYNANKADIKSWHASNYLRNKQSITDKNKKYYEQHRAIENKKRAVHWTKQYHLNVNFRVASNLRARLRGALKNQSKVGSHIEYLGCSVEEVKKHLQAKFQPGMTWENYGEWHIDHIYPLSKFNLSDINQLRVACNYSNLQPLWAADNLKKSNKVL